MNATLPFSRNKTQHFSTSTSRTRPYIHLATASTNGELGTMLIIGSCVQTGSHEFDLSLHGDVSRERNKETQIWENSIWNWAWTSDCVTGKFLPHRPWNLTWILLTYEGSGTRNFRMRPEVWDLHMFQAWSWSHVCETSSPSSDRQVPTRAFMAGKAVIVQTD